MDKSNTKRQQEINLPRLEPEIAVDVKMALVYVAGYAHRNEGCLDYTHNTSPCYRLTIYTTIL